VDGAQPARPNCAEQGVRRRRDHLQRDCACCCRNTPSSPKRSGRTSRGGKTVHEVQAYVDEFQARRHPRIVIRVELPLRWRWASRWVKIAPSGDQNQRVPNSHRQCGGSAEKQGVPLEDVVEMTGTPASHTTALASSYPLYAPEMTSRAPQRQVGVVSARRVRSARRWLTGVGAGATVFRTVTSLSHSCIEIFMAEFMNGEGASALEALWLAKAPMVSGETGETDEHQPEDSARTDAQDVEEFWPRDFERDSGHLIRSLGVHYGRASDGGVAVQSRTAARGRSLRHRPAIARGRAHDASGGFRICAACSLTFGECALIRGA